MIVEKRPGTYLLWLHCTQPDSVTIGKQGKLYLQPGWYGYVGSALGPGGLYSRLHHHLSPPARLHWHIDYLRQSIPVTEIWYSYGSKRREHHWAKILAECSPSPPPLKGFGSSDCRCPAHLFFFPRQPALEEILQHLGCIKFIGKF